MAAAVFPDNTVMCNFACIGRVDLLAAHLRGRGRWVEAVAAEAEASAGHLPDLRRLVNAGWLGEPIEIIEEPHVRAVERLRIDVFGGTRARPLQHLGEAQSCFLLTNDPTWSDAAWVTDDRDAYQYAKARGIITRRTVDLFREMVAWSDLTADAAFSLLEEIDGIRGLRLPAGPKDLQ